MSYILDALKKAERERDISQVPTITTVHDLVATPRKRLWIVSVILVLGFSFALWFFFPSIRTNTVSMPSHDGEPSGETVPSNLNRVEESKTLNAGLTPQQSLRTSTNSNIALSDEIPKERIEPDLVTGDSLSHSPEDGAPVFKQAVSASDHALDQSAETSPDSHPGDDSLRVSSNSESEDTQENTTKGPERARAPSGDIRGKTSSLQDMMAGMTISVLSFSENKSERLVFINGRKYVEGDYVREDCLLESITPEGAVLNYKGERAILRPGP